MNKTQWLLCPAGEKMALSQVVTEEGGHQFQAIDVNLIYWVPKSLTLIPALSGIPCV